MDNDRSIRPGVQSRRPRAARLGINAQSLMYIGKRHDAGGTERAEAMGEGHIEPERAGEGSSMS